MEIRTGRNRYREALRSPGLLSIAILVPITACLSFGSCVSTGVSGTGTSATAGAASAFSERSVDIVRNYDSPDGKIHYDFQAKWNIGPSGLSPEADKAFLALIRSQAIQVLGNPENRRIPVSLTDRADLGLSDFKSFLTENREFNRPIGSYERVRAFLEQAPKGYATARLEYEGFFAGAHPVAMRTWVNVDSKGALLRYEDILPTEAARSVVSHYAEASYRSKRHIPADAPLNLFGVVPGQDFPLSASFGLTNAGLVLYYNYYEIEPYVSGPLSVLVPASKLKDISPVW